MALTAVASVLVAGLLVLGAAGCGASETDSEGTSSTPQSSPESAEEPSAAAEAEESQSADAEPVVITITDFKFSTPESVAPGATVMVVNEDRSSHTVTSEANDFEEAVVEGGADGTFTAPTEPGEYAFVCDFHPEMTGTLAVK